MTSQAPPKPSHLEPSPLGAKEYWDSLYMNELSNHAADPSNVGTIWFDDSSAEDKILSYLYSPELGLDLETTSFLDIGTGNGHFLFRLRESAEVDSEEDADEEGECENALNGNLHKDTNPTPISFRGRILGTDYSSQSITFARRLVATKVPAPDPPIEFLHFDILTSAAAEVLTGSNEHGWDVVLDKGTFDAISLSEETDARGRRIVEGYRGRLLPLMRVGGCFLVTSCNWTEEELRAWFEGPWKGEEGEEGMLEYFGRMAYPSFSFGGRKGQAISTVCFKKAKT